MNLQKFLPFSLKKSELNSNVTSPQDENANVHAIEPAFSNKLLKNGHKDEPDFQSKYYDTFPRSQQK